jgi:hypothetical protein
LEIDRTATFVLNFHMKIGGSLILVAFILAAVLPLKPSFAESHSSNSASFCTLDICNKTNSSMLSSVDAPTFCEKTYELFKPAFTGSHTITDPISFLYQFVILKDRPPQA